MKNGQNVDIRPKIKVGKGIKLIVITLIITFCTAKGGKNVSTCKPLAC